eukprot:TRINITY_DN21336_c1_g1_i2.p1 TRINITY_DN21336_c1_g1~~TRINITY_DN21336_c1_g1_i2.p1  ORF type:complete len:472 (-),score=68.12 TRINITY_DN21336_c1_g1_i2:85-1500(-)
MIIKERIMTKFNLQYIIIFELLVDSVWLQAVLCPAKLIGHAVLPAETTQNVPDDVPLGLNVTGRFVDDGNQRVEELGAIEFPTGYAMPMIAEPVQGISGIKTIRGANDNPTGTYWVIVDNGYGTKLNSADALLKAMRIRPNFETGEVAFSDQNTVYLHDPDHVYPYPIVNEYSQQRYLTGADFDPESIQPIGEFIYIGDEFGPFILKFDLDGKLLEVFDIPSPFFQARQSMSPDHPNQVLPSTVTQGLTEPFEVRRSGGLEGMAQSPDGKKLYPIMEKPMFNLTLQDYDVDAEGNSYVRLFEMDVESVEVSPTNLKYRLEGPDHAIGDFNLISDELGLIIERDSQQGDPRLMCTGVESDDVFCFEEVAEFKRIYLVNINQTDDNGFITKIAYIDLLNIQDPDTVSSTGTLGVRFTFPFVTVESVDIVDNNTIIVANDNNFPFSTGRAPDLSDDSEFILLDVSEMLAGATDC